MGDLKIPDLNQVMIAGRLTSDPELKYTSGGQAYVKVGVASSRYFKDKAGQRKEETTFVDVTVWGQSAEFIGQRMHKGAAVLVEGSLRTDEWEDRQTGQKRSKIVINGRRVQPMEWEPRDGQERGRQEEYAGGNAPRPSMGGCQDYTDEPIPEDDIPF